MRFGVAALFLIVGCSSSERVREAEPAPKVGAATAVADPSGSSNDLDAIDNGSDLPRPTGAPQSSDR